MKPSTLASYLESLAGLIRSCRPGESLPRVQVKAGARPSLDMSGTRVAGPLPIPTMDAETLGLVSRLFPGIAGSTVTPSAELEALRTQVARTLESHNETITERNRLRNELLIANRQLAEAVKQARERDGELEALRRTVDRMRVAPSVTVAPAPVPFTLRQIEARDQREKEAREARNIPAPAVPADLLNMIADETAKAQNPSPVQARPSFTIHPVVLAFPPNHQGKVLSASAVTLDEVRALFTFRFIDSRDATKGGYWLAKDPTAPAVHALVATLTKHGAFTRDTIPA